MRLCKSTVAAHLVTFLGCMRSQSHYLKNAQAKRTQLITPIIKSAKRALLLSGTPAVRARHSAVCLPEGFIGLHAAPVQLNRPIELYTQISALCPGLFPSLHEFGARYCQARRAFLRRLECERRATHGARAGAADRARVGVQGGVQPHGAALSADAALHDPPHEVGGAPLPPLHRITSCVTPLLGRVQVLKQLPAKRRQGVSVQVPPKALSGLGQGRQLLERMRDRAVAEQLLDQAQNNKQMTALFQETGRAKLPAVIDCALTSAVAP
jgi:hypothetical protein